MVNHQLIASSIPVVAEGNQERGLMVNLDANDGDSFLNVAGDENSGAWRDLTNHRYLPDITPSEHFNVVEWTGNGQTNRLIDVGFKPALIMLKQNTGDPGTTQPIRFIDSLRGATTATEASGVSYVATDEVLGFTHNGFIIGDSDSINKNNVNYRYTAWCWKGNPVETESLTEASTGGDYTRTVNEKGGFSAINVPSSSGDANSVHSFQHGLNVSPSMFFLKQNSLFNSLTYVAQDAFRSIANGYSSLTSDASSEAAPAGALNSQTLGQVNVSNAYLNSTPSNSSIYSFTEIRGYSKMGTFVGTGTAEAYDVGFKPKMMMVKRVSGGAGDDLEWKLYDSTRGTSNELGLASEGLQAYAVRAPAFNNNGWSWSTSERSINNLMGVEYAYMSFADDSVPLNEKLDGEDDIIFRASPHKHDSVSPQPTDAAVLDLSGFGSHMARASSIVKNITTDFLRFPGSNLDDVKGIIKTDVTGSKSFSFWFNIPANPAGVSAPVLFSIQNLYSSTINLVQFIVGGTTNGRSLQMSSSQNHGTGHGAVSGFSSFDQNNDRFDGAGWQQLVYTEDGTDGSDKQFYINGLPITTIIFNQNGNDLQDGIIDLDIDRQLQDFGGNTFPAQVLFGNSGVVANSLQRSFEGKVGEGIIFNSKLSSSQVLSNYNKTKNRYIYDGNDAILSSPGSALPQYSTDGDTSFFTLGTDRYFEFEEPIANVFSVSFWIRLRDPGVAGQIPIFSNASQHPTDKSLHWEDDGTTNGTGWFYKHARSDNNNNRIIGSITPYNTWEHIVFQKGLGDSYDFYQNNVLTGTCTAGDMDDITDIGRDFETVSANKFRFGDFDISKFQVYSLRLDSPEITVLYNQGR